MQFRIVVLLVIAGLGPAGLHAQEAGPYIGIKGGVYSLNDVGPDDGDSDFGDYAMGGYAGYKFRVPLALEIEYLDLAEDNVLFNYDFEGSLFIASLKPTLTLGNHWELFGKLGWAWMEGDLQGARQWDARKIDRSVENDSFLAGFGAVLRFGPVHFRVEYQFNEWELDYYDDAETELVTLGVGYEF